MSVESIGGDAFNFFHGLSVTLPKSVKKLGANAFDKYVTIYTDLKHDENYPEDWKLPETQMDSSFIYSFDSYAPAFPVKRRIITDCVFVCEDGVPYVDSFNPEHNLDSDAGNSDNPYQVPGRAGVRRLGRRQRKRSLAYGVSYLSESFGKRPIFIGSRFELYA